MASQLVNQEVFGHEDQPTIYYLVGYHTQIKTFKLHIKALVRRGYRIVAFDYTPHILDQGKPEMVVNALEFILTNVANDMKQHKVAGVFGISLGTFFGLSVLGLAGVDKAVFVTGGVNLAEAVWQRPFLQREKDVFVNHGASYSFLQGSWNPYDITANPSKIKGKHVLFMNSSSDKVVVLRDVQKNIINWQKAGVEVDLIKVRWLSHALAIIRGCLRIRRTVRFFR